jgi:hypothetical protein
MDKTFEELLDEFRRTSENFSVMQSDDNVYTPEELNAAYDERQAARADVLAAFEAMRERVEAAKYLLEEFQSVPLREDCFVERMENLLYKGEWKCPNCRALLDGVSLRYCPKCECRI